MVRVFYTHWNKDEALRVVGLLRDAGHTVAHHWSTEPDAASWKTLKENLPDAMVISLTRLPSHGRHLAEWFWEAKYRRAIPIVFVDGDPEKVAIARKQFPKAIFAAGDRLAETLREILAKNPSA